MKEEDCLGGGILGEEAVGLSAGTAQGRPPPAPPPPQASDPGKEEK